MRVQVQIDSTVGPSSVSAVPTSWRGSGEFTLASESHWEVCTILLHMLRALWQVYYVAYSELRSLSYVLHFPANFALTLSNFHYCTGVILFRALYLGGWDIVKDYFDIENASFFTRFVAAQVRTSR